MKPTKIVTIGGGTGQFMLLSGLKKYPFELTAIVSMADDGGSTGVLRDELGVLPPGDVRQCLIALSDSPAMVRDLMSYRFAEGGLSGHSFGNLMLSALEKITGSFDSAVTEAAQILHVRGRVLPVVTQSAALEITLTDGVVLTGEDSINHADIQSNHDIAQITLTPKMPGNSEAVRAITEADIVVIGPGNLYCSVVPNLVVPEIAQAIAQSSATVIYNPNLTNKKGHTLGFAVHDYIAVIEQYIGIGRIDYITYNNHQPSEARQKQYSTYEGENALVTLDESQERTYKVVRGDFISQQKAVYSAADKLAHIRALIRHDSNKLAHAIALIAWHSSADGLEVI